MTSLAAKTYRLGVLISLVTTKRSDKQECHAAEPKYRKDSSVTRARQIYFNRKGLGRFAQLVAVCANE